MYVCLYVWMDACMHACMYVYYLYIYICVCVCAYKTNGKNKKRDKKKHAKSCKAFWLTNQAREGRDRCPASPFLAARRFAVAPPGSEGLWSSGRVDQTPWNPTSGSNKPRPEGLSQSLNRINLSQEIHSPQIHGISKNGCRRTSEGKPRKDMGLHTSHCIPMKWLVSCPRIICWLYYQYISYIPWNPRRNPCQNQRLVSHSAPAPPKATRTWAQLLPSESGILIVFSPGPWAVDPTGG